MFAKTLRKLIVVTFHLLLIITPFFFTWVNEELFEFPKMLLVYGMTTIIAGLWSLRMILERRWIVHSSRLNWPLLAFFASQLLATIFSIHFRTSIFGYYTRFHGGLLSTISYMTLFYAFISNVHKRELPAFFVSLFAAGLGVAAYAIPEHFGVSPSCILISGQADVQCWVQDVQTRVFATFGQPNWLAAYAITVIPLGLTLASFRNHKKNVRSIFLSHYRQILFGATSIALFMTLIFTRSRSGFTAFLISILILTVGTWWLSWRKSNLRTIWSQHSFLIYGGLGLIMMAAIAGFGSPFSKTLGSYLSPTPTTSSNPTTNPTSTLPPVNRLEKGGTDSGEIRKIVWQGAIDVWKRYPLFGSGVATFAYSYYQDRPMAHNLVSEWDFLYNKAHNEFLNFLATTGLIGLITYAGLLIWFGITCLKMVFSSEDSHSQLDRLTVLSLFSGVVALTVSNFFGFSTVMVSVLMYLFFAWTELIVTDQKTHQSLVAVHPTSTPVNGKQYLGVGLVSIVGVILLIKTINIWRADRLYATGKSYIQAQYALEGVQKLQQAVQLAPKEALFHDELAETYAELAVAFKQQQESTQAAQLALAALQETDLTLKLNPRHLNFYKTQVRIFINLSEIEPQLLESAEQTLATALTLAPTDAKLMYNLGLIQISRGETEQGIKSLASAIDMKPNYEAARMALAQQYENQDQPEAARAQYQYIYDYITKNNQEVNQKLELTPTP